MACGSSRRGSRTCLLTKNNIGRVLVSFCRSCSVLCCSAARSSPPCLALPPWAVPPVGRVPCPPAALLLVVVVLGSVGLRCRARCVARCFWVGSLRLSCWFSACCVVCFFGVGAAFSGVGAAFSGGGLLLALPFFSYLRVVLGIPSSASCPFPSASAVVAAFGFSRVFCWFALAVSRVPVSRSLPFSGRVAAACPRFASWLCGRLGCSWSVAWGVACLCASRVGVSVLSGGVSSGCVQLSLFS